MSQHTSGPWSLYQQGDEYGCWGKGGTRVFSIRKGVEPMNEDARLIAKAPEMHVQLQMVEEFLNSRPPHIYFPPNLRTGIRALLREIEGEK
mgnify:CR=1 FL=1